MQTIVKQEWNIFGPGTLVHEETSLESIQSD